MHVLITGINGILSNALLETQPKWVDSICGLGRQPHTHLNLVLKNYFAIELGLEESRNHRINQISKIIRDYQIDLIIHTAANHRPAQDPKVYSQNILGTQEVLEAILRSRRHTRLAAIGSSASYGNHWGTIDESTPFRPATSYGVSKASCDWMVEEYGRNREMDTIRIRPFNLIGPGQHQTFFCTRVSRQIAEIERGERKPQIELHQPDFIRDFVDVQDIARGVWLLAKNGRRHQAYNLASQSGPTLKSMAKKLIELSTKNIELICLIGPKRHANIARQVGTSYMAWKHTGWKAQTPIQTTLKKILDHERARSQH